ncbi:MAG TPA: sigma-70 family RNA polymerase sigma factor [Nakamurella sp.]
MSPDDLDTTSSRSGTALLPPRRSPGSPTIASAPTGDRATRVRELLEHTAACTDPDELQRLRRSVVTQYLPVATSLAARYAGRGVERSDLEQLAFLGLVKAVRRWEPGRSEDFLQFAVPTIVGEIKRYFRDHSWLVRPPRRIQELRAAITEAEQTGRHRDGTPATEAELAAATGVTPREIGEARAAAACCRPRSLDESQGAGLALALSWGADDQELRRVEDKATVDRLLETLTDREREVVRMRFGNGWSQSRIGTEIGVSQMQVSRWLRTIADKLRTSIDT